MAEITIKTDGTLENTVLTVDGKDVTKDQSVVGINLYACAPYKSEMMMDTYKGNISISYSIVNDAGVIERHSIGGSGDEYGCGIGQSESSGDSSESSSDSTTVATTVAPVAVAEDQKIKSADQVVRFIGKSIPVEKEKLINTIIKHCADNKIACPSKDELAVRSELSLKDKIEDLGITIEG